MRDNERETKTLPDSTVQMAANALILRACISLWEHIMSIHIRRKPIPSRPMYVNSDITDNHNTPGTQSDTQAWFTNSQNNREHTRKTNWDDMYLVFLPELSQ